MGGVSGGQLASAVNEEGGLGIIGGGYRDQRAGYGGAEYIDRVLRAAGSSPDRRRQRHLVACEIPSPV